MPKLKTIVIMGIVGLVVYYIFHDPNGAAATLENIASHAKTGADSAVAFLHNVTN